MGADGDRVLPRRGRGTRPGSCSAANAPPSTLHSKPARSPAALENVTVAVVPLTCAPEIAVSGPVESVT